MNKASPNKPEIRIQTAELVNTFLQKGGTITFGTTGKRTASNRSWNPKDMRASVANRGHKATTLRAQGYAKGSSNS